MIKTQLISVFFSFLFLFEGHAQFSGLRFSGHEELPDLRTGLDLAPEKSLMVKHVMELSFDMYLQPYQAANFGYIFRAIIGDRNMDLTLLMTTEGANKFQLVIGRQVSKISFTLPYKILTSEWINFRIKLNPSEHAIICFINNTILTDTLKEWPFGKDFKLLFGANTYSHYSTTDVLHMNIRDIKIYDGDRLAYYWPLNQMEGGIAKEIQQNADGKVTNPHWVMKLHYFWENILNLEINGQAQLTFNPENETVFIVSDDSLYSFRIPDVSFNKISYQNRYEVIYNSLIYDTLRDQLILYSIDDGYKSSFDFQAMRWPIISGERNSMTKYWHHNRIISPDGKLYVFAGYGMHEYKNKVFRFNESLNRWDSVIFHGEFPPRYLAGAGYNPNDSLYYIIGGYGSESGEQVSNPDYYYDMCTYSFKDSTFHTVFNFKNLASEFCFANSLFIDKNTNSIYGLIYPKFQFENNLQLVRIPIDKPEIIEAGSQIDFKFLDIKSYTDLYYSKLSNKLIATTSYYDDSKTKVSVYTISFPPQQTLPESEKKYSGESNLLIVIVLSSGILFLLAGYFFIIRGRRNKIVNGDSSEKMKTVPTFLTSEKSEPRQIENSSIILFGGFQVIDKNGADITSNFTPLLEKLFLYILLHSIRNNKGVSSNKLVEVFWFDKTDESARNNRAVNIVKLRTILESVGKTDISKETGCWKLEFDPSQTYIDYYNYLLLVTREKELTKEQIIHLLSIIERGSFLLNTDADWIDPYKSEVSNDIIDTLLGYIERNKDESDFIIHLTNCIFYFDSANEEAMSIKCRTLSKLGKHGLARQAFSSFIREYELLYGEKYLKSFHDIIS